MSANWKPSGTAAAPVGDDARLRERPTWAELDEAHARIEALARENAALSELAERLKLEARSHAMEARTANATIAAIYQACSGATGEPGNWHGAQPVIDKLAAAERCIRAAEKVRDWPMGGPSVWSDFNAARAGITLSADSGGEGGV